MICLVRYLAGFVLGSSTYASYATFTSFAQLARITVVSRRSLCELVVTGKDKSSHGDAH